MTAVYQDMPVQKGKVLIFQCGIYQCTLSWKDGELIFQRGQDGLNDATVLSLRFCGQKPTVHLVATHIWWSCHGRLANAMELVAVAKVIRTFVDTTDMATTIQEWIAYQRQLANEYPVESNRSKWQRVGEENMLSLLESFLAEQEQK